MLLVLLAFGLLGGCGDGDVAVPDVVGRYELDPMTYALELTREHLEIDGKPRTDVSPERRAEVRKAAVERARSIRLGIELRADGSFLARVIDAKGEQRLGGTWSQEGDEVLFRTTAIPGGRVTTIPDVRARYVDGQLAFGDDVSGFVVPQAFTLRKVD